MIAALLALAPLTLTPTDDIWVYPHASDPQTDPFLRVWGSNGAAVAGKDNDLAEFSYSFMKFDVSAAPTSATLKTAKLVLTFVGGAGFSAESAKKSPLQVRGLKGDFTEKTWNYDMTAKMEVGELLSSVVPVASKDGKEFTVTVDLMKPAFAKYWKSAKKTMAFALTSAINPADEGRAAIYKFYSKDNEKAAWRPRLEIETE